MDHEDFLLLAAKQLGEGLSDQEEAGLTAHLASCPSCRAVTVAMRRDDILLRGQLGVAAVSPRVRRRVLDEAAGARRPDWRLMLALAATLLIAGVTVPLIAGGGRSVMSAPVATLESVAPSPSVAAIDSTGSLSPSPAATETADPATPSPSPMPAWSVDGAFDWGKAPPKRDSVAAHLENGKPTGEWSHKVPAVAPSQFYGGPITCLVVDGPDAWMAGPATTAPDGAKDSAVFIHVHDGGPDGAGDLVVLWMTNESQTIATMEQWCMRRFIPSGPFPITSGEVTVDDGR
jgi:hypothetical protein